MKKLTVSVLLLAMLLSMSCGSEPSGTTSDTTAASGGADATAADSSDPYADDLGAMDFGGEEFNIYTRVTPMFWPYLNVTEETGDIFNDSIFVRNRNIEERFNVVIKEDTFKQAEGNDMPRNILLSGDDTYDIVITRCVNMYNYAVEGMIHEVDEIPNLNPDKPYWNQQLYNDLSVGSSHYFAVGEFNISANDFVHVLLFNKDMMKDYKMEEPYDLVSSGKWTLDKFTEMAVQVGADLNGDSVMDENDQYGHISMDKQILPGFWIGAGMLSIEKNDKNLLEFNLPTDETYINYCLKVMEIMFDKKVWRVNNQGTHAEELKLFCQGKSLFTDATCYEISQIREVEIDFGMLPYPKADEKQEKYYTRIEGCDLFGVPMSCKNMEMTGAVLEAMACDSYRDVKPAYYETSLKVKYTRDDESAKMLDIIFENRVFDWGDTILCPEIRDGVLLQIIRNDNRNFASELASVKTTLDEKVKTYNEAFND